MIRSIACAVVACAAATPAAFAGPYANVETNAGWVGDDYSGATTDLHVGYEGALGENAGYYIQGGPAIVAIDGEDTDTQFSGKAGVGVDVTEKVGVYGEVSFLTADDDDDFGLGGKLGVKYSF